MKRIASYIALMAGLLMAASCNILEGRMVDWVNLDVVIEATDDDGVSIISPKMDGLSVTFKGETYTLPDIDNATTKANPAIWYGLMAREYKQGDGTTAYRLYFGEIDGAEDMDEDITIDWPDGSRDIIHYHCSNHREWPTVSCDRSWQLNGSPHDGSLFRLTGKK